MKRNIYSAIVESMSDGLLVLDFQGFITHINRSGLSLLGLETEETRKKTYVQLFMGEPENDEFNDILFAGIQNKETRLYREVPYRRPDRGLIDLAVTTSFLRDDGGNQGNTGIVVVFRDISELKALNRARERVLDHLSHELRTPLSIITATLKRMQTPDNMKSVERINRNLTRLQDIQLEVEDIVKRKASHEEIKHGNSLDQTLDLLAVLTEDCPEHNTSIQTVKEMVREYFVVKQSDVKGISLGECILKAVDRAKELSSHRDMELEAEIAEDSFLPIDNDVLEKVFIGIIKNAIENTPDGGRIMVMVRAMPGIIEAEIKDTGVGITAESQKQIFSGFYHAKETDLYSTRSPFDFGAGGKGLDLLRVKIFSDIYQFNVECFSRRCKYIPGEKDSCPGAISGCRSIQNREECFQSGGTAFKLSFSTGRMAN